MMTYRNTGILAKTFYGVTFNPRESKNVPGYINDPSFVISSVEHIEQNNKEDKVDKPGKQNKESKQKVDTVESAKPEA